MRKINKEEKVIMRQKKKLKNREEKLLQKKDDSFFKEKIKPLKNKVENKIPQKVTEGINKAFEKGFNIIFEKGTSVIEKSYNTGRLKDEADINKYILAKEISSRNLRKIDKGVIKVNMMNHGLTAVEGTALGFLGIGFPDIPIFISVILRTIYEICLNYGFEYDNDKEKAFILNVICAGVSDKNDRKRFSDECDRIAHDIESGVDFDTDIENMTKETSKRLVDSLLVSKFIQGIPIVGAVGGAANYIVLNNISRMAKLKYKKRFINKLL